MEFLRLRIRGYKSYGPEWSELPLNVKGVHQISGTNGVGKTNLVEAFLWILTGKQLKAEAKVDKVVNWHLPKKEGAEGHLELIADDGHTYRIERYRRHPVFRNTIRIIRDDVPVDDPGVAADPQREIERLVGLKFDELVGSLVYSAEDFKSFIEKKTAEKRQFAETFFRIDRFQEPAKLAREERLEAKRRLDANEAELSRAAERLRVEEERLTQTRNDANGWELQRRSNLEALQRESSEIEGFAPQTVITQWNEIDRLSQARENADREYQRIRRERETAEAQAARSQTALTDKQISEELERHAARERVQGRIDAVLAEKAGADAEVLRAQAEVDRAVQAEQAALIAAQNARAQAAMYEANEQGALAQQANQALLDLQAAKQVLADADKLDCFNCGQRLPAHMASEQEIERRRNAAQGRIDAVLGRIEAVKSELRRSMDARASLILQAESGERDAARIAEDKESKALVLARAHQGLVDLGQALHGDQDADPPVIGLYGDLAALPMPSMPRDGLQQQRVLAAERATLERQVENRRRIEAEALVTLNSANAAINEAVRPIISRENAQTKITRLAVVEQAIRSNEQAINPHSSAAEGSAQRVSEFSGEVRRVEIELAADRELHPILNALVTAFEQDLPQTVLKQLLPRFNAFLQGYLDALLFGCSLRFNEALEDYLVYEGKEVEPHEMSTGQRARINFAICLATFSTMLWERGAVSNVCFFDEVLDFGLDDAGQSEAFELLKGLAMSIYIITHKATLVEEFDSQFVAQRQTGGFTQLKKVV